MDEFHKAAAAVMRAAKMLADAQTEFEICEHVYKGVVERNEQLLNKELGEAYASE